MIKVGYQGVKGCFSWEGLINFFENYKNINSINYDFFSEVFTALNNQQIDYGFLPIENSLGGSLIENYDLLTENNFKILGEYQMHINQCLFINKKADITTLKNVYSHPQALAQCKNNIIKMDLIPKDYFDTAGSTKMALKNINTACICPKEIGLKNNLQLIKENFQDNNINITRFYLITANHKYINTISGKRTNFTLSFIIDDGIGKLAQILSLFDKQSINLTKIMSRPFKNNVTEKFKYIFYCEGSHHSTYDIFKSWTYNNLPNVNILGIFPIYNQNKLPLNDQFKIGIVGFGRFGQFLAKQMVTYGWEVHCTSKSNYNQIAKKIGVHYHLKENFEKIKLDCVLFSVSINSFENVIKNINFDFFKNKLIVDVLSVKKYPYKILTQLLPESADILLTHPMFGPDSAKITWNNKKFIYYNVRITDNKRLNNFLNFWSFNNCDMISLSPDWHDQYAANSQFLTHLTGRILNELNLSSTSIDTDGFKNLLKLVDCTTNDSWDLFDGLYKYNISSEETLNKFQWALSNINKKLNNNEIKKSATTEFFEKIQTLDNIINLAIGIPVNSSFPPIKLTLKTNHLQYTPVSGIDKLKRKIVLYCNKRENSKFDNYNCIITPGGKAALLLSLAAISNPGNEWLIPSPYWVSYPDLVKSINCKYKMINTTLTNNWNINLYNIEIEFEKKSVLGIIICHPNNPLGKNYSDNFLKQLIVLSRKYNKWIICDEVYLSWSNASSILKFTQLNDKIISINSFSKGWGLMGLRVGWILTPHLISNKIISLKSTWLTCTSNFSQMVALKMLGKKWNLEYKKLELEANKWYTLFNNYKIIYLKLDGGIYLFPNIQKILLEKTVEQFCNDLLNEGLAIMPGTNFGNKYHVRITLVLDSDKNDKAINIFKNYITKKN